MFNMDNYLHPKEEIVTDPLEAEQLGVIPLTAHNIMVKGTGLSLANYIYKLHTLIWNLKATSKGNTVILTWEGDPNVDIIVDGNYNVSDKEKHPNGNLSHTLTLPRGKHTFKVTAWKSIFPLYTSVSVEGTVASIYGDCTITPYNVGMHSFWVRLSGCADLWVSQDGGDRHKAISPMPVSGLSPYQTVELCFYTEEGVLVKCISVTTDDIPAEIKAYNDGKPPVITSLSDMSFSDTTDANAILGKFTFDDMGLPITGIRIVGDLDKYFTATVDGNIYLNKKADATLLSKVWHLVLEITNAKGSDTQSFTVTYTSKAPSFQDNFMLTLKENTVAGTVISNMPIDDKGQPPVTVTILDAAIDFYLTIQPNGDIVVDAPMDFENPPAGFLPDPLDPTNRLIQGDIPIKVSNAIASKTGNISITLLNEQDNPPYWKNVGVTLANIAENNTIGAVITDISTEVLSPSAPITGYAIDDTTNFAIDTNGVITAKVSFDYETTNSYDINVTATNKFGTSIQHTVVVKITDVVVEQPPKFTTSTADMSIMENNAIGATITDVSTLLDPAIPATSYAVDDTVNFAVDSTGHLKANVVFDYETLTTYIVNVTASNSVGTSNTLTITVNILDDQTGKEAPPVFAQANITLDKSYATLSTGTILSNQTAGTAGFYTYSISGSDFNIDPNTGVVRHKAYPDINSIPDPMSATITATNKDTGATASYTLTVNRLCSAPAVKDYTFDIDLKASYTAGDVIIPLPSDLPAVDCPILGYRLSAPIPFPATGVNLIADTAGIKVDGSANIANPNIALKEADFTVNDTPPTNGTWTLPSLQLDTAGGMNDYVHTKAVLQVQTKSGLYDIANITIKLRNAVYTGHLWDDIKLSTTDLSMVNLRGATEIYPSPKTYSQWNGTDVNTNHDYSISRWNTKSADVIVNPIHTHIFWKGGRETDLSYWNISNLQTLSFEAVAAGMVFTGTASPMSHTDKARNWEAQITSSGKKLYSDPLEGLEYDLTKIPRDPNRIIVSGTATYQFRYGEYRVIYAWEYALFSQTRRLDNGLDPSYGIRGADRPKQLRVPMLIDYSPADRGNITSGLGMIYESSDPLIDRASIRDGYPFTTSQITLYSAYGFGWYIDDNNVAQWDGGAPEVYEYVTTPPAGKIDISPFVKDIRTDKVVGNIILVFDKAEIEGVLGLDAYGNLDQSKAFLGIRVRNSHGEALYPYDYTVTPNKAYDYYDVYKRYNY